MVSSRLRLLLICIFILGSLPWILNSIVKPNKAPHLPSYLDNFTRPIALCHRGSRYMGPENSIHMHQWALKMGCDVLEFDVRLTKDNKLVIHHDPNLDRTANIKGNVDQFTYAELQVVDSAYKYSPSSGVKTPPYSDKDFPFRNKGYHIPLLSTFMDAFETNFKNIEIKDNSPLAAELLWKELQRKPQYLRNVIVASGHCDVLRYFRYISGGTVATSACEKEGLAFFVTHKIGIGNFWFWLFAPEYIAYQAPVVSSGVWLNEKYFVDAAHNMDQKFMYWVINDATLAEELLSLGADGLVSDRPDIIYSVFHKLGYTNSSLEERLEGVKINSSETFFIPEANPREIHTCLSIGCKLLPFIMNNFIPISVSVAVTLVFIVFKPSSSNATKSQHHGSETSQKSKKVPKKK